MSLVYITYRVSSKKESEQKRHLMLTDGSFSAALCQFEQEFPNAVIVKSEVSTEGLSIDPQFLIKYGAGRNEISKRSAPEVGGSRVPQRGIDF